jgi:hypothetical protein
MALMVLMLGACKLPKKAKDSYPSDRLVIRPELKERKPANLAILPVEAVESMDSIGKTKLRKLIYDQFLEKDYAPLSLTFTDRTLRDMGRFHTPISLETQWNTSPFKGAMSCYCDAVAFVSIEHYLESGQPDQHGIDVWGKVALFDAETMELLMENYTRLPLHPTDPGGGRERFIRKALEEFAELLLKPLPRRKSS